MGPERKLDPSQMSERDRQMMGSGTEDEIAKIQKERVISDAGLLEGGAEYKLQGSGNLILEPTIEQIKKIKDEHERRELLEKLLVDLTEDEKRAGYKYKSRISEILAVLTREQTDKRDAEYHPWESDIFVRGKPLEGVKALRIHLANSFKKDPLEAHFEAVSQLIDQKDCPHCKAGKIFKVDAGSGGVDMALECVACDYYKRL